MHRPPRWSCDCRSPHEWPLRRLPRPVRAALDPPRSGSVSRHVHDRAAESCRDSAYCGVKSRSSSTCMAIPSGPARSISSRISYQTGSSIPTERSVRAIRGCMLLPARSRLNQARLKPIRGSLSPSNGSACTCRSGLPFRHGSIEHHPSATRVGMRCSLYLPSAAVDRAWPRTAHQRCAPPGALVGVTRDGKL